MAGDLSSGGVLGAQQTKELKSYGERYQNLVNERSEVNEGIKELMDEAREAGFDPKIIRKAAKELMADQAKAAAEREMIDSYKEAMKGLPLFEHAQAA
jgi:uncharacterized protein (UPF0335 family)